MKNDPFVALPNSVPILVLQGFLADTDLLFAFLLSSHPPHLPDTLHGIPPALHPSLQPHSVAEQPKPNSFPLPIPLLPL